MATINKNLSSYNPEEIPAPGNKQFGIVVADWNDEITYALRDGAIDTLLKHGVKKQHIHVMHVPGSVELTYGAKQLAETCDAVMVLGCVIQGETRHFDFVCDSVTQGITRLNIAYNQPFIFGLLTTNNMEQARDRAGGKHGNKGIEAAVTALKMINLSVKHPD